MSSRPHLRHEKPMHWFSLTRAALRACLWAAAPLAPLALCLAPVQAQDYPNRAIRMIVPFAPGGATDIPARLLAPKLSEVLGQQVVVENRPGAGGIIGIEAASKSAADGYTLLMATNGEFVMNTAIYTKLPYDPVRDFAPIAIVVENPMLIVVPTNSPYNSLADLLSAARAKPGALAYSTAGTGSTSHVLTELLAAEAGVKLLHVPYKGGAPASAAVASGEVGLSLISLGSALNFVKGGKAKALAITRATRHPNFPEWPTVKESGVPNFAESIWIGLAAPTGTPREIVNRLSTEVGRALRSNELRERLAAMGSEPVGTTPDEAAARIRREIARYTPVIKQAGIRAE